MSKVGIVNPGAMGISIAASARSAGHTVVWSSAGRSAASRQRAADQGLLDAGSIAELCAACELVLCVCPPHAAESVGQAVIEAGFQGMYCDGNAIAPRKAIAIGEAMGAAGIDFIDGGIIGPPAWEPGTTRFYLSGGRAAQVADLFAGTVTEAIVIGNEIGRASALKMVFASQTKGFTALQSAIQAVAERLGVREDLYREWERRDSDAASRAQNSMRGVTEKAWRFTGEMKEIADTFAGAGLPNGFFLAAHDIYQGMSHFKDADELPTLDEVLAALLDARD